MRDMLLGYLGFSGLCYDIIVRVLSNELIKFNWNRWSRCITADSAEVNIVC